MLYIYPARLLRANGPMLALTFILCLCGGLLLAQGITTKRNYIRVDQFGYLPGAPKVAVIANAQSGFNSSYGINLNAGVNVQLRRASDNTVVKQGKANAWNGGATDGFSGDKGWWYDFSDFTTPGTYYIRITENGGNTVNSNNFRIADDVYAVVLKKAMQMFYYARVDQNKTAAYASGAKWTDAPWYVGTDQDRNAIFLNNNSVRRDIRGGWIDAGDPNKYVTFATPAVHNLLTTYDQHPDFWNNFRLDIPESSNSAPDILDEVKWEIDWIRRMQDGDGGVFIKNGILNDGGYISPPSTDSRKRYFDQKCPSATIVAAGMMAHAALSYSTAGAFPSDVSDLTTRAEKAWTWFTNSPNKSERCDGGEIEAGDADGAGDQYANETTAEAAVAAVYLYALTGKSKYNDYFKSNYQSLRPYTTGEFASEWAEYRANQGEALLYYTTLSGADSGVKNAILNLKKSSAKSSGPYYSVQEGQNLYRARQYYNLWGSNSLMSHNGSDNMDFINYNLNSGNHGSYRARAGAIVNYIHGVNPFGMTYLSNMYGEGAEYCADEMWHTWFAPNTKYDNIDGGNVGPAPGILSGGTQNGGYLGYVKVGTNSFNVTVASQPEQKKFTVDNDASFVNGSQKQPWAYNEPAIYYQASYVKLLANFVADSGSTGGGDPPPATTDEVTSTNAPGSVRQGSAVDITVNYSAAGSRDVVIYLQLDTDPWSTYTEGRKTVSAGTGSVTVRVNVPDNLPVANDAYQLQTIVTTVGGNWDTRKANLNKINVDGLAKIVAEPVVTNQYIYREALASGWADWSWNGSSVAKDGLAKNGSFAYKRIANGSGGALSLRHSSGKTGTDLTSIKFWARSWNTNFTSIFNARQNDSDDGPSTNLAITPTYKEFTVSRAALGSPATIRRLVWTIPANRSLFIDDLRLVYTTSGQSQVQQWVSTDRDQATTAIEPSLSVFPNPNPGRFTAEIVSVRDMPDVRLQFFDLTGRLVDELRLDLFAGPNRLSVDLNRGNIPAGIYLLRASSTDDSLQLSEKVTVE